MKKIVFILSFLFAICVLFSSCAHPSAVPIFAVIEQEEPAK